MPDSAPIGRRRTRDTSYLRTSVQHVIPEPSLTRQRIRGWMLRAVDAAMAENPDIIEVELALRLVDTDEAHELNSQFRGRDYATNVLTFEYGIDPDGIARGDIILCVPVLRREAQEQHKTLQQHAAHLVIHGALHALGYDHENEDDAAHMEAIETALLAGLGFPDPYTPR
ncbi:rRNA maturation RNase YbeY [Advenella kashmirensis]|uniref:rRNA maturation RNase YbeY n=1 Tax=Advenella kashmirensis TaxID=310575 RepID=UPI00041C9BA1|nr:rRNA maturation RNase YbeY [Advenella kashmirensis]